MPVQIRFYGVEEANQVLPEAATAARALRLYRRQAFKLRSRMAVLRLIWGDDVIRRRDSDGDDYRATVRAMRFLGPGRRRALRRIKRLGVRVRGTREGGVHFYSLRGNEIILLCWGPGEERVTHWHWPDQGCGGRMPLEVLEEDGEAY